MAALFLNTIPAAEAEKKSASAALHAEKPHDRLFAERVLAFVLIAIFAFWLRAQDPGFTTAYMDESVYVVYGRMFLSRHFEAPLANPLRWSFGWYLWPMMATAADRIGGLIAIRELAAVLGTATVMAVYGFARRLFDDAVALASAALYAVLAPAVLASRIATRDAGALFFFSFALWAFASAWQTNRRRSWVAAAACLLAAFLCKYIVAIYVPFLVLIALRKGWRAVLAFCLPLAIALSAYAIFYWADLNHLLFYARSYNSLRSSGAQVWEIYVRRRLDLWAVALLALVALLVEGHRRTVLLLWLGAVLTFAFQWKTRADFDFWKHAAYALIFLVPPAVCAIFAAAKKLGRSSGAQTVFAIAGVICLCGFAALAGKTLDYDKTVFWPNVEPALSYLEGRLPNNATVLVDDSVFRYYLNPQLSQSQIVDPFHFQYGQLQDADAYRAAVEDGWFEYIVLDGGTGKDAKALQSAIQGHLQRYALCMQMPDPTLGQTIEVFQRGACTPAVAADRISAVEITSPSGNSVVQNVTPVIGHVSGASAGWYLQPEVFSNRWYGMHRVVPQADGSFAATALFAGDGEQACHEMLRVRLYDQHGEPRAVALIANLKKNGSDCR